MSLPVLLPRATEDQRLVRWSIGPRCLTSACPELRALVNQGILETFDAGPGEVRTRLAGDRSWSADGALVRSALFAALAKPAPEAILSDDELRAAVADVVAREVAPLIASHGGAIRIHSIADGVLTVELSGACQGCPIAGRTLSALVATKVQECCPQVREVRAHQPVRSRRATAPWTHRFVTRRDPS